MCWGLPETVLGQDVDQVFEYRTPVLVAIRDRRLGLLYWCFLLGTLSYVLIYQILYNTGYLLVATPTGAHRFSLRQPSLPLGCDPNYDSGCKADFPALSSLPYCLQNNDTEEGCSSNAYLTADRQTCAKRRQCVLWDDLDVWIPEGSDLLIATRKSSLAQSSSCDSESSGDATCNSSWETIPGTSVDGFVGGVENFTLLIDHAARDSSGKMGLGAVSRDIQGVLSIPKNSALCKSLSEKGRTVCSDEKLTEPTTNAPCFVDPALASSDGYDVFTVKEWIGAGSLDLDDWSGDKNNKNESVRARGHIVVISIEYTNIIPWKGASDKITYKYSVSTLQGSSYKAVSKSDVVALNSTTVLSRKVEKQYGIKIIILTSGRLGVFDFNTLLLQLAAGSALLGIAKLMTDYLALYLLPEKELYAAAKIKLTEDFGDIRKKQLESDSPDNGASLVKQTSASGSQESSVASTSVVISQ